MSYLRVIPRDLFNDANLLKCLGRLYLELERLNIPGVQLEEIRDIDTPFAIHQDNLDGSTYCEDVVLVVRGIQHHLMRPLNSREPWPLKLWHENEEMPVFTEAGELTEEFKRFLLCCTS